MNNPEIKSVFFSVDDLERMIDAGVFVGRLGKIELIEGELCRMSPASEGHDDLILYLTRWSHRVVGEQYFVAVQIGLRLLKTESMPEPDLYWVDARRQRGRPTAVVVPLVIEISSSSLEYDLETKRRLYALDEIAEYWVIDSRTETIVVHRQPVGESYVQIQTFKHPDQPSPLCLPDARLDIDWLFHG